MRMPFQIVNEISALIQDVGTGTISINNNTIICTKSFHYEKTRFAQRESRVHKGDLGFVKNVIHNPVTRVYILKV